MTQIGFFRLKGTSDDFFEDINLEFLEEIKFIFEQKTFKILKVHENSLKLISSQPNASSHRLPPLNHIVFQVLLHLINII
jgi:hypothetical protein